MKNWPVVFACQINCSHGPASEHRYDGKDHGAVAVADVPLRALIVTAARRFRQLVTGLDWAIFGQAALWAPAAVRDVALNREIERRPVRAGLAARNDFLKHCFERRSFGL